MKDYPATFSMKLSTVLERAMVRECLMQSWRSRLHLTNLFSILAMFIDKVNQLEIELGLMEKSLESLETVRDNVEAEVSRSSCQLSDMDHLVERIMREERRCQVSVTSFYVSNQKYFN